MKKKRAMSLQNCLDYQEKPMGFSGVWRKVLGDPECTGSWTIYGLSGNGKTRFTLQLVKYLMSIATNKVAYNSLEEGMSGTFKKGLVESGLSAEHHHRFIFWDKMKLEEMITALKRKRSPNIIVIDSIQYLDINYQTYQDLVEQFPKKLFIWISHEKGAQPDGTCAKKVAYNGHITIRVRDFYAVALKDRYGGGAKYDVWPERHNGIIQEEIVHGTDETQSRVGEGE